MASSSPSSSSSSSSSSTQDLPLRIIERALEQFGRAGFDGASTREIARLSGTAMSSITYHFGGKQGLYLACADHIAEVVGDVYAPLLELIRDQPPVHAAQAQSRLLALVETFARFLLSSRSAAFAEFLAREQQHPTEAFERIYSRVMGPILTTCIDLVGICRPSLSDDERRALVLNIAGMVLILRLGRACVVRTMQVTDLDAATADNLVAGIMRSAETLITEG
jgi:AcrR family transcriptional regulator